MMTLISTRKTNRYALARYMGQIVLVIALYFVAGQLGFLLTALHGAVSLFWLPSGYALAVILLYGDDLWPGVALGACLVNAAQGQPAGFLLATSCGNTLEALIGAHLLRHYFGFHNTLNRTQDAIRLLVVGAGLSTMASATIGILALCLTGRAAWAEYGSLWAVWWLGDAVGIVAFTPVLLAWGTQKAINISWRAALEPILWLILLVVVGVIVFQGRLIGSEFALAFLPFPLLMWAALRLGIRAAVTGSFIIAVLAVLRILSEPGPFPTGSVTDNLIILWLFIGITSGTSLLLAATVQERREGQALISRLNAELESRALDLESANKELDAYNASVSHDLRGPLSNIIGFISVILEREPSQMAPSSVELLHHVDSSARKMERLVFNLLEFSRMSHQALNKEQIEPAAVVRDALLELGIPPLASDAGRLKVVTGDLPSCQADPLLLRQVYTNLLSNAVKYTQECDRPSIEVGFQKDSGAYFVRDNGIGFDMKKAGRLFTPFERLHSGPQYSGTGIGLSLVSRIVERHGGRIWAESSPGCGATFYFTLG